MLGEGRGSVHTFKYLAVTFGGVCFALAHMWAWAYAQGATGYPAKPIRIIVPLAPGGPPDLVGRTIAQHLTVGLGQQMIVENRPGAGGTIGAGSIAETPARGKSTRCRDS